jgi:hypothetical protein
MSSLADWLAKFYSVVLLRTSLLTVRGAAQRD